MITKIETNMYDEIEEIPNCTVQILHNSITDEYSIGWWRNENPPIGMEDFEQE